MTTHVNGSFTMDMHGRHGTIRYDEDGKALDIPWDISGSPRYSILLAPLDLRHWSQPIDESVSPEKQRQILAGLRKWLRSQRHTTDIDLPRWSFFCSETCAQSGCDEKALRGSAYCRDHFDESLLRS